MWMWVKSAVAIGLFASAGHAAIFDLTLQAHRDIYVGQPSASLTVGGITATLTAGETPSSTFTPLLNYGSGHFGIQTDGSGGQPNEFDVDNSNRVEFLTITFNKNVSLDQIELSQMGTNEKARVTIAGNTPVTLIGSAGPVFNFVSDNIIPIGQSLVISAINESGAGRWSMLNFTVSEVILVVPEPVAGAAVLLGLPCLLLRRAR
jgi:hypothetical protein